MLIFVYAWECVDADDHDFRTLHFPEYAHLSCKEMYLFEHCDERSHLSGEGMRSVCCETCQTGNFLMIFLENIPVKYFPIFVISKSKNVVWYPVGITWVMENMS